MFVVAKKEQSKILMGMLSYANDLTDLTAIQQEIEWYDHDEHRELLLWREVDSDRYPVCIGIEPLYGTVLVRRIVFSPGLSEAEKQYLGQTILHELTLRFPDEGITGTIITQPILNTWRDK
ncbi:reductase [Weissella muntiaci]|uniref:Reductase n=1 Tax=Weissella muntiaci TaxID=2508881 RepID=A0A6C2C2V5_9LACO|nr:reductase [Weissella muntiaci]TYC48039.1 reductase [Weissella muntiaci]